MNIEVPKQPVRVFTADGDRRRDLHSYATQIRTNFGAGEAAGLLEGRYIGSDPGMTLVFIDAACTEWRSLMTQEAGWTQLV